MSLADQVVIRELYANQSHTYAQLATRFGISQSTVGNVVNEARDTRLCTFAGCPKRLYARALCKGHYRQRYVDLRDTLTALRRSRQDDAPEAVRLEYAENARVRRLRVLYNLSAAQYDDLLAAQGGVCAFCLRTSADGRSLSVDHDHRCCPGQVSCGLCVRWLLCGSCNLALGKFLDDANVLRRAADALDVWGRRHD